MLTGSPSKPLNARRITTCKQRPQHNQGLDIEPGVRLSPHRAQANPSELIGSIVIHPIGTALGPFTAGAASNLPSGSDAH